MKMSGRDRWLALGLVVILIVMTVAATTRQARDVVVPYTSGSSAPDGTRALWLWLEEGGYEVTSTISGEFDMPRGTTLALMLEPIEQISSTQWARIDQWVDEGGTLVLAGNGLGTFIAMEHYEVRQRYLDTTTSNLHPQTPLLASPPMTAPAQADVNTYLSTERDVYITHIANNGQPVVISFAQGEGQVILSSTAYPFSNAGLKQIGNPELVLNLIHAAPEGTIWFDEWHHGIHAATEGRLVGPRDWLFQSWVGRSMLYISAVIFLALLLGGRRFGRTLTLPQDRARRAPLEYITAIASLSRRAGHRRHVLGQYHRRIKAELGHRYRLNPALPDDQFIAALEGYNPPFDVAMLRDLLARLQQARVSENEMVDLAARVARLLEERPSSQRLVPPR